MGYLDAYGAGVDRRLRLMKLSAIALLIVLIIGVLLYFQFRDYGEVRKAEAFFEKLRAGDYKGAYATWGCTDATPCRDYRFEKFMEDWGPKSPYGNAAQAELGKTYSCDSGIIQIVRYPGQDNVNLWVDRQTGFVSFAPWNIKQIPDNARTRFAAWMWGVTRNCQPLIAP